MEDNDEKTPLSEEERKARFIKFYSMFLEVNLALNSMLEESLFPPNIVGIVALFTSAISLCRMKKLNESKVFAQAIEVENYTNQLAKMAAGKEEDPEIRKKIEDYLKRFDPVVEN